MWTEGHTVGQDLKAIPILLRTILLKDLVYFLHQKQYPLHLVLEELSLIIQRLLQLTLLWEIVGSYNSPII